MQLAVHYQEPEFTSERKIKARHDSLDESLSRPSRAWSEPGKGRTQMHAGRRVLLLAAHYELQIVKCQASRCEKLRSDNKRHLQRQREIHNTKRVRRSAHLDARHRSGEV
ncbi:hypothetical protein CesoFtcFv8_009734 [Champsocephalus esox]|uniref:Uncharacterized protein n=1 Tax=Champsocephalus esox TaxID=159716 RepID=A0AAN8C4E7_9TELE|nr:hypothetical protein CesoFtcFv8_009734 [Champsocephalus esox]